MNIFRARRAGGLGKAVEGRGRNQQDLQVCKGVWLKGVEHDALQGRGERKILVYVYLCSVFQVVW